MKNLLIMTLIVGLMSQFIYADMRSMARIEEQIKSRYGLNSPCDYRAAVNKEDCIKRDERTCTGKGTELYQASCMALGYKRVAWVDTPGWFVCGVKCDADVEYALKNKNFRYVELTNGSSPSDYILYSAEGRYEALLLVKYVLNLISMNCTAHQDSGNLDFEYLTGVCLGYSQEDIEFYFQRIFFKNKTGYYPEEQKERFDQFIQHEWASTGFLDFQQAKINIDLWIKQHSSVEQLESDIKELQKNIPNIRLKYDQPISGFIGQHSESLAEYLTWYGKHQVTKLAANLWNKIRIS